MYFCRAAWQKVALLARVSSSFKLARNAAPLRQMSHGDVPGSSGKNIFFCAVLGASLAGAGFYTYRTLVSDKTRYYDRISELKNRPRIELTPKPWPPKSKEDAAEMEMAVAIITDVAAAHVAIPAAALSGESVIPATATPEETVALATAVPEEAVIPASIPQEAMIISVAVADQVGVPAGAVADDAATPTSSVAEETAGPAAVPDEAVILSVAVADQVGIPAAAIAEEASTRTAEAPASKTIEAAEDKVSE
uniref:Mitochondria localized glutamic acid rich protein n=1 Tax=Latimeria chalumnae TaxID=7897 RepID=H3B3Y8_LATCH